MKLCDTLDCTPKKLVFFSAVVFCVTSPNNGCKGDYQKAGRLFFLLPMSKRNCNRFALGILNTLKSTVAHNCHSKRKRLAAKEITSRQKKKPHGKKKNLTAKRKTSRQKEKFRRKKNINLTAKRKLLTAYRKTSRRKEKESLGIWSSFRSAPWDKKMQYRGQQLIIASRHLEALERGGDVLLQLRSTSCRWRALLLKLCKWKGILTYLIVYYFFTEKKQSN